MSAVARHRGNLSWRFACGIEEEVRWGRGAEDDAAAVSAAADGIRMLAIFLLKLSKGVLACAFAEIASL
jgi:hypothetical protein